MPKRTERGPRDRFDDVPEDLARVGAHRAPARPRRGLLVFGWAALATGVLVGAGVLGLQTIEAGVGGPASAAPSSAVASAAGPAPTIDPKASVVVLNGTGTAGLAAAAAKTAGKDGWHVTSTANASEQTVKTSTVYYATAGQLGAAKGLAKSLGIEKAPVRSDQFTVAGVPRLAVVLGSDFTDR